MFGKMMNRYYYGKSGKGDYTKEDLPETRLQLFWEMLRVRFTALFRVNLLYMIAWIPAIFVIGRAVSLLFSGLVNLGDMQAQLEAGEITAEAFAQNNALFIDAIKTIVLQTLVLLVPAIAVTGPFTAGLCYVTRNWARDEHSFILSDFKDAVKGNWKQALLTSTITGFVPLILYITFVFYGEMSNQSMLFVFPQMICLIIGLVWLCSLMYIYPQMITYDLKYKALIRNSLIMAIGRLPMTVGIKLLTVVPTAIAIAVSILTPYMQIALLALAAYYIFFGFAFSRFIQASYTNAVFDRYLNANIEGAQVGRGLYVEEDEEDEEAAQESESTEA